MNINKFVNNSPEDIFHSSSYAKVARGGKLGSTSIESFSQRADRNNRRQSVQRYGDSMIGRGHMREVARTQLDTANPLKADEGTVHPNRQQSSARGAGVPKRLGASAQIPPRQTFHEPPTRGYNPYS